jgi:hypothetical protein
MATINLPVDYVDEFLAELRDREAESIVKGFASLAFLRSQGRTLKKYLQRQFLDFIWTKVVPRLPSIETQQEFEQQHHKWVEQLRKLLKTQKEQKLSYGQAQKSLNVFLKFYIDWASLPDCSSSCRLRQWLHCPLDKVVMEGLSKEFRDDYKSRIRPCYKGSPQQRFSLSKMDEVSYHAWQNWIRKLSSDKPVLVDVKWALSLGRGE